jgi:adenosylmethionine-8-amino-7-oxononanoate aminotransferase
VDAVGGLWCTNIGLGREDMVEAIADQVRKLAYSLLESICRYDPHSGRGSGHQAGRTGPR